MDANMPSLSARFSIYAIWDRGRDGIRYNRYTKQGQNLNFAKSENQKI